MPKFGKKTSILSTLNYISSKKLIRCSFFAIFHEKLLLPCLFCQKNLQSPKNTMFSYLYLIKKSSILWKTQCSHVIFSIFFFKNQMLLCPNLVKKRQFCQNYKILWAKKVYRMPFLSDFHERWNALMPILCPKDVHCLRNTLLWCTYIFLKKRPFYQK